MIIEIFRVNRPFTPVLLIIIAVILWIDGFVFYENIILPEDHPAPLYAAIARFFNAHPLFNVILGFVFMLLQAFLLNRIITEKNLTDRNSFLPALIFIIVMSGHKGFMGLQPAMFANLFLILALNTIFEVFKEEAVHLEIFNVGLFIAVAGLFYYPAILLFVLLIVSLFLYYVFTPRSFMAALMGFVVPALFTFVYYFWFDRTTELLSIYAGLWRFDNFFPQQTTVFVWLSLVVFFVVGAIAVGKLFFGVLPDRPVRIRKRFQVLLVYLINALLIVFFVVTDTANWQMLLLLPYSLILAGFLNESKNKIINNIMIGVLIILIVSSKFAGI